MQDTKKLVLAYGWGVANAGDLAITVGALETLSKIVDPVKIGIVSRYPAGEPYDLTPYVREHFQDVTVTPSPFVFSRRGKITSLLERLYGFALMGLCLLSPRFATRIAPRNAGLRMMVDAEMILINGGNLLYWNQHRKSLPRLAALLLPVLIAWRMGKPYGFLPQTMGPFDGGLVSWAIGRAVQRARFVLFREDKSLENAQVVADLTKTLCHVSSDMAFFMGRSEHAELTCDEILRRKGLQHGQYIAVTLRATQLGDPEINQGGSVDEQSVKTVARKLASAIARALDQPFGSLRVVGVRQTVLDGSVTEEFAYEFERLTGCSVTVIEEYDPLVLSEFYARAKVLVGMRLHSLIFAMSRSTPVLGVYREHFGPKTPGILSRMGLSQYSINLDSTAESVIAERLRELLFNHDRVRLQLQSTVDSEGKTLEGILKKLLTSVADGER